jgi:2-isopropylmalate synthase
LKRKFEGVVAVGGEEHKLVGMGNGPISSLANALSTIGIDLDVADYKEHSISGDSKAVGDGKNVKAVSYIECTSAGSAQKVWGVGIHEDVVQSSLIALLSDASNVSAYYPLASIIANEIQFISSRPNTPIPFRPKHGPKLSEDLDLVNGGLSVPKPSKGLPNGQQTVSTLEAKVDGA